jgi:uncharacterized protein with PIN domain
VVEVLRRFDLFGLVEPFQRCLRCNSLLRPAAKEEVWDLLPPRVREEQGEFHQCPACGQVYWKGSHYRRMARFVEHLLEGNGPPTEGAAEASRAQRGSGPAPHPG